MEEKLKALENMTLEEWGIIKILIDDKFDEERLKNTFKCDENVLKRSKNFNCLKKPLVVPK